jgi:hypothetical protein
MPAAMAAFSISARMRITFSVMDIRLLLSCIAQENKQAAKLCSAACLLCAKGRGFQRLNGDKGGDGVLVDHLLLAFTDQYHHKTVVAGNNAPELEAIHKKQCYGNSIPADFT